MLHKDVADAVAESHPGKVVMLMAYAPTAWPSRKIPHFGKHVIAEMMNLNPEYIEAWRGKVAGFTGFTYWFNTQCPMGVNLHMTADEVTTTGGPDAEGGGIIVAKVETGEPHEVDTGYNGETAWYTGSVDDGDGDGLFHLSVTGRLSHANLDDHFQSMLHSQSRAADEAAAESEERKETAEYRMLREQRKAREGTTLTEKASAASAHRTNLEEHILQHKDSLILMRLSIQSKIQGP